MMKRPAKMTARKPINSSTVISVCIGVRLCSCHAVLFLEMSVSCGSTWLAMGL